MSGFLSPVDIQHLTGIKTGRKGETREQLQIKELRRMNIVFRVNARGAPIVTWSAVDGFQPSEPAANQPWQPNVLNFRKSA